MTAPPAKPGRDPRLDFFRGLAFVIIYISHVHGNWAWAQWIPRHFGYSDAADMFVFMSGFAAAIAFGGTYLRRGWWLGTTRIAFRCWQLYWCHIGLFFAIVGASIATTRYLDTGVDYVVQLNIAPFVRTHTELLLLDLMTLSYVPNYFDILPMYMVVLAMVPVAMLLARVHPLLPVAASLALWGAHQHYDFFLQGGRFYERQHEWYFNPFGWQVLFFAGFALSRGWVRPPMRSKALFWTCLAFVLYAALFSREFVREALPYGTFLRDFIFEHRLAHRNDYGIVRLIHFLALAYVVVWLLRGREQLLHRFGFLIVKCGQQSLPVFLMSMLLSRLAGTALDLLGRDEALDYALVNLGGIGCLILTAYVVGWFKTQPWRSPPKPAEATRTTIAGGTAPAPAPAPAE